MLSFVCVLFLCMECYRCAQCIFYFCLGTASSPSLCFHSQSFSLSVFHSLFLSVSNSPSVCLILCASLPLLLSISLFLPLSLTLSLRLDNYLYSRIFYTIILIPIFSCQFFCILQDCGQSSLPFRSL